jgi:AraC-like DNA-binding protein
MEPAWAPVFKALHGPPFNYPGIDALAEIRGVSRKSFTQWFRKVTGQSVKEYYLDKVMTYADKMLKENMPQKELAVRCGFSNAQNFMKAWRDHHAGNKNKSGGGFRN